MFLNRCLGQTGTHRDAADRERRHAPQNGSGAFLIDTFISL